MPKVAVSKESLEGIKPVPAGMYDVVLNGFEPKWPKSNKDSVNLNPVLKIVNHPKFNGQRLFMNLNTKISNFMQDLAHGFGLPMEEEAGEMHLPGGAKAWSGTDDDPTTWKYTGPLLGKTAKVEVIESSYAGRAKNEIKMFVCKIPDCQTKYPEIQHSTNMIKK
jgi:hypothetical protein